MEGTLLRMVPLLIFPWMLFSLVFIVYGENTSEETFVADGILVRKTELMEAESERKRVKEAMELKAKLDQEEALLYNESQKWTKKLPTKCQVCRLMVTEIQRKLNVFGKVRTTTEKGRLVYYKDDMVLWNVFDELCNEMTKYNIDKKTPFRYRKGVKSYLRRKTDEMTKDAHNTQWFWNIDKADIDDPTGEIRRLSKQCYVMLVVNQDTIRRWFYSSQESDPLKWLCAKRILQRRYPRGCLWTQDKYLDQLLQNNKDMEQDNETGYKINYHQEL